MYRVYIGINENKGEKVYSGQNAEEYIKWYYEKHYPDDSLINDFIKVTYDYADEKTKQELEDWFFSGNWLIREVEE